MLQEALDILRNILAAFGGSGLALGTVLFLAWWKNPHNVETIIAQIMRVFAFLGGGVKRLRIKLEIQGRLNRHIESIDRWSDGQASYGISIEWVQPGARRESFLQGGTVVCRMDYDSHPHLNYLNAALLYLQSGFLIEGRKYLASTTRKAVDLTVVSLMLGKSGERGVAQTYYDSILPSEFDQNPELHASYEEMQHIERHGLFTNIFLPEMVAYNVATGAAPPRRAHHQEIEDFIKFLSDLASAADTRNADAELDFNDRHIQVSVIYVGKREKLSRQGYDPYIHMIRICKTRGAHTVYVVATGASRNSLSHICEAAENQGLCRVLDSYDFRRQLPETGQWMPARVFRLLVAD